MAHQKIAYVRISSESQSSLRQLPDIQFDKTFIDIFSGSVKSRPQLEACFNYCREGDVLHIHSIDRLARNVFDLQEWVTKFLAKKVTIIFFTENLTFTGDDNPMSKLTLQIMGSFAEFERNMIRSRQKEGIEAAKKAGKHLGRPSKTNKKLMNEAKELKSQGISIRQIALSLNLSRPTIYKLLENA